MADSKHGRQFLSPVYLNEQMVLSCAAYLFQGIETQSEISDTTKSQGAGKLGLSIPVLTSLLGFEGKAQIETALERRSIKQYTVGSLHMHVLDDLREKNMIRDIAGARMSEVVSNLDDDAGYIKIRASLRPSDYYNLIAILKRAIPSLASASRLLLRESLPTNSSGSKAQRGSNLSARKNNVDIDQVEKVLTDLVEQLENDYLTAGQIEMIMWTESDCPVAVGVVDLDTSGWAPSELTAKLSDGTYYVIGKITKKVKRGSCIDLLQKTTLAKLLNLLSALNAYGVWTELDRKEESRVIMQALRSFFQEQVMLKVPGPAVRITAMSVCV